MDFTEAYFYIGDHWIDNGRNSFKPLFNAWFVSEMRKNQCYHELITLHQGSEETVDTYANKFIKLAERVGLTDAVQKKRMFLMEFNPAYASLIYAQNPGDFNATIETARRVEIEYNY